MKGSFVILEYGKAFEQLRRLRRRAT